MGAECKSENSKVGDKPVLRHPPGAPMAGAG
jgi:hypothetical protein